MGSHVSLASLHSNEGVGAGGAGHYRARQGILPDRHRRPTLSGWHLLNLGQFAWTSTSGPRQRAETAACEGRAQHTLRSLESTGHSISASTRSNRTEGTHAGLLF